METSDRMPPLVVSSVAIVGIIWVLMVLGIRLYLRCKLNGPIGNDDYAAILATSLGIAQSALVLASVNSGLGKQSSSIQNELTHDEKTVKLGYAATLLYLAATYVSRSSSCLLYIRLTSTRSHLLAAFTGLCISIIGGSICLLATAFQCKMPEPWAAPHGRQCIDTWTLWRGVETTAIALEVFIFGISLLLVWSLRMRLGLKATVVFAFSVRLLVLLPTSLRLLYIHHTTQSPNPISNPTTNQTSSIYMNVSVTITTTLTTHLATMACTLPCLKQFLGIFESGVYTPGTVTGTGTGAGSGGYTVGSGSGSGSRKGGTLRSDRSDSIALVPLARGGCAGAPGPAIPNNGPANAATRYRATSVGGESSSSADNDNSSEIEASLRPDRSFGEFSAASVSTTADARSFTSDRSGAAMIIKETREWEVRRG